MDEGDGWRRARRAASLLEVIRGDRPRAGERLPGRPRYALPFRPVMIYGIGLNYRDTVEEMGWEIPARPYLFPKLPSSAIGDGEPIRIDDTVTRRADWEAELALIIGRTCRHVRPEHALAQVFGYTTANDVSARDLQAEDGQWLRGKGLDTFCPLGPLVVTADEVADPQDLRVRTWVNGTRMQDGTTADMIFPVAELIAYCSRFFTLYPGDVILTGTPAGCGDFRRPRLSLRPGDHVEVEIGGIGRLGNPVEEDGPTGGREVSSLAQ
ncbi:hypothetical protein GCM10010191_19510 [Actinomadura vinacea]|uniref:Fumarylacetoacetase-like C-terminal domain-containing protein n=1 Tax=Actinomadura vinacea TaxID=115336 RepID=A0ABN3IRR5_9ACTN